MMSMTYVSERHGIFYNDRSSDRKGRLFMGFLTGKTAIITGGGRAVLSDGSCGSIGYGIATAYAKEGANLVITGRNVKKLEDASMGSKYYLYRLMSARGLIMKQLCRT